MHSLWRCSPFFIKCSKSIRKDKEKYCVAGDSEKQGTERTPCKCFRCGSVDNIIAKCPKTPKDNKKRKNKSVSVKELIVHRKKNVRTMIMIMTKRHIHLWQK